MLRIAVQSKGRLYDETMELIAQTGIKFAAVKRTLLVPSRNFPVEILFLRDDDIPDSVATGTADVGIVGLNEVLEKASIAQEKMPDKVFIGTDEKGYRIVRIKDDGAGVRENKLHAPGTCLNPE